MLSFIHLKVSSTPFSNEYFGLHPRLLALEQSKKILTSISGFEVSNSIFNFFPETEIIFCTTSFTEIPVAAPRLNIFSYFQSYFLKLF